jgi:hypothetical protein
MPTTGEKALHSSCSVVTMNSNPFYYFIISHVPLKFHVPFFQIFLLFLSFFDTDPNPIQHFRLNTDPDPDLIRIRLQSGSRVLMTKNCKKFTTGNFFLLSKATIYLSMGPHKDAQATEEACLQPSKENIQHFKI